MEVEAHHALRIDTVLQLHADGVDLGESDTLIRIKANLGSYLKRSYHD